MAEEQSTRHYEPTPLLRYIIVGIAFILIVILLAWIFFGRNSNTSNNQANTNKPQVAQAPAKPAKPSQPAEPSTNGSNGSSSSSSSGTGSGTSGSQSSQSSNNPNSNQQSGQSQQLANTGPGDVIALALGTAVLAGLWKRYQLHAKS